MSDGFQIRAFETIEEFRECVSLQEETWGVGFSERVAPAILKVSQILGGVAAGAYDEEGVLTGFVFGMTGLRNGELVHWSDMLAVKRGVRDSGLGTTLKAYQREQVLSRGVKTMLWTFDPLQARNAHVNFNKLGVVVREYEEDMYGQTDSPLHRGIGTDRLIALWLLASPRVRERLARSRIASEPGPAEAPLALGLDDRVDSHPGPAAPRLSLEDGSLGVTIPSDIVKLMDEDPGLARAWREATRSVFTEYLGRGYEVREFVRGDWTSTYWLERRPAESTAEAVR